MHCDKTQSALIDFYYQELAPHEHRAALAHLLSCDACAWELRRLHEDLGKAEQQWRETPSPALRRTLVAEVQALGNPSVWQRAARLLTLPMPVYQAAGLALLLLGLWVGAGQLTAPGETTGGPTHTSAQRDGSLETLPVNYDGQGLLAVDDHLL